MSYGLTSLQKELYILILLIKKPPGFKILNILSKKASLSPGLNCIKTRSPTTKSTAEKLRAFVKFSQSVQRKFSFSKTSCFILFKVLKYIFREKSINITLSKISDRAERSCGVTPKTKTG